MEKTPPKLAPPGAGIPWPARQVLRFFVKPFVIRRFSWEKCERHFARESQKILGLIQGLDERQLAERVLVPPQAGLEDSSRYWSVAMALEHLMIVGEQIGQAIVELSHGRVPAGEANTARVKPPVQEEPLRTLKRFQDFCGTLPTRIQLKLGDRDAKPRFRHPWFGLMTARQWHWLLGVHQGLHRKQIEAIVRGLNPRSSSP